MSRSSAPVLVLSARDNVGVALAALAGGVNAEGIEVAPVEDIPAGHKLALREIPAGEPVVKYGQPVGIATIDITPGSHVHTHNMGTEGLASVKASSVEACSHMAESEELSFQGFRRADGQVGTRNFVGIVSTVNCSATVVRQIAAAFTDVVLADYPHVDGLCPITHATGCGMSRAGQGFGVLQRTLSGYLRHANMAAVLVVGLGCEVNDVAGLLKAAGATEDKRLRTLEIQAAGGTRAAIDAGKHIVGELLSIANEDRRSSVPASALKLGLQCGGSDSFSGITANPALGNAADRLVRAGGTVILAETPEIFGAEHLLVARAADASIADRLIERLDWWRRYAAQHGATLDNNPSPGNIAGGISTIFEKSLGAVMKSGTSPLRGVFDYAERIEMAGFVFMDSPGYDPCSVTGEIASGANLVCFTTGRGSVFGAKPVPALKLATNAETARRMAEDIDYDCSSILTGSVSIETAGKEIFEHILDIAGGKKSASERLGFGDFEFVPWQLGAVL